MRVVTSEIHARVGLVAATVEGFLDGSSVPTERTAERLHSWYSEALVRSPVPPGDSTEHRRVPVDELHRFYTAAVAHASLDAVADWACVSVGTLRQFLARTGKLQARTRRNLGLYYLARKGIPEDPPAGAGEVQDAAAVPRQAAPAPEPPPAVPGEPELSPEQRRINSIRAYARVRAGAKTARVIANDIGLNFGTFYNFLRGNDPIPRTREKLEAWFDRDSVTAEGAATLRDQLLGESEDDASAHAVSPGALRAFYAAAITRGTASPHSLATDARVSLAPFQRFLAGGDVGKETLSRLQAFYADHAMKKVAALDAILEDLDGYVRTRARRRVLSGLARGYKEAALPTPGWVELLMAQRL